MKEKAGTIPYVVINNEVEFLFMIPSDSKYGGSKPQIAKGVIEKNEGIEETAIREAIEEVGILKYEELFKVLQVKIKDYILHIYAMHLLDKKTGSFHYETKEVIWLKEKDIEKVRNDQRETINYAMKRIKKRENLS